MRSWFYSIFPPQPSMPIIYMYSFFLALCTDPSCNDHQECASPNNCVCKNGWGGTLCDIRELKNISFTLFQCKSVLTITIFSQFCVKSLCVCGTLAFAFVTLRVAWSLNWLLSHPVSLLSIPIY